MAHSGCAGGGSGSSASSRRSNLAARRCGAIRAEFGDHNAQPCHRRSWRGADEQPIDAFGLLLASDAFAPAVFNTTLPVAWVPTLELTVHVRGVPAPGPLACVFRSRFVHGGLLEEDGELWDAAGRLVGLSRQLALAPRAG